MSGKQQKIVRHGQQQSTKPSHRHNVAQCIFYDSYIRITGDKLIPPRRGVIIVNCAFRASRYNSSPAAALQPLGYASQPHRYT